MLPTAAWAQAAPDQTNPNAQQPPPPPAATTVPGEPNKTAKAPEGTIVITGIRRSVQDSIAIKRRETSMVEAVSAEEIGKLPDVSIAESIARLPGLAAQRVGGRAQIISIRGFSPDFTTVLLNGRQQASSGYNRAVEFDQYPSELLSSVVVYKTPDADISGMGLAGTVDLRTVRPIEYGKRAFAVNLRGEYDQGGGRNPGFSNKGWRGSVSYIDQNEDGTLGWSIGYAHLDAPSHTNHTKNWYYENYGGYFGDASENILSGQEARAINSRDIRDGVMGTLEWKPSDAVHSVLDLYYSRFKQHTLTTGAEWFSDYWTGDPITITPSKIVTRDGNAFDVADHVSGVAPVLRWDDNKRTDHLFSVGLNNDFRLAEHTHLFADLSYSSNKRDETDIEIFGGYGVGPLLTRVFDSYDRVIPADNFPQFTGFGLNYADPNEVSLGDRSAWGGYGSEGHLKAPHIKETLGSGDLTLKQDFQGTSIGNFLSSIEAGVDYTHRHKDKTVTELDLFLKNGRQQVLIPSQDQLGPVSLGFAGDMNVLGVDVEDLVNNANVYDIVQLQDANHFDKSWDIKEDITTFKAKANIDSGSLHGNVGIQVVRQKQESQGLRINELVTPIQLVQTDVSKSYTDVLPSLNLYYDLDSRSRLRFAAAKVMMRPRMDDMRANLVPSFNGDVCAGNPPCSPGQTVHPWSADGGNPNLEPWRAKEIDVAYEWYGGKATYFSVNAFNFWLDDWIYTQLGTADFSDLTPPPTQLASIPSNVVISPIGQVSMPANGTGGWIRGVEVSGAIEFGRLARFLDGFGAEGSIARSAYHLPPTSLADTNGILPGFSKWTYNITGYYEKNGFQARVSYRYRDKYQGETVQLFTNLGYTYILADRQMDAQVGYTFQPGSRLNGLGILLQVSNVLDSPYRTSVGVNGTQVLENYEKYGRQWLLGASYHF